ncbi:inositol monophosphatase family protein [Kitasatospora sp. NPDC057015]|uniref:inositol monophosphatase family protein n=1 Tax=Kitasatospora sp. NPDC057015 TaxID=3346001 RepID=UPI0036381176
MTIPADPPLPSGPADAPSRAEDLELAQQLADLAGEIALHHFRRAEPRVKADRSLVTEADLEIEREIARLLASRRPGDGLVAEEFHQDTAGPRRRWVVDPVDHTNNYARGHPAFATLIALVEDDQPVVGVIGAPALERRWWGAAGLGAYADGRRMEVSTVSDLADAHLSFSQLEAWRDRELLDRLADLVGAVRWSFGSGGWLGQMWVAEGSFDLSLDSTGHLWDLAASQIIVEEAGGVFTDLRGVRTAGNGAAVVGNPRLHPLALDLLRRP